MGAQETQLLKCLVSKLNVSAGNKQSTGTLLIEILEGTSTNLTSNAGSYQYNYAVIQFEFSPFDSGYGRYVLDGVSDPLSLGIKVIDQSLLILEGANEINGFKFGSISGVANMNVLLFYIP